MADRWIDDRREGLGRWGRWSIAFALLIGASLFGGAFSSQAQTFLEDDPLWTDPDRLDMPIPRANRVSDYYSFLVNTFSQPGDVKGLALNVNTLGEVPNSSWYTNRHYTQHLSRDVLVRGPNTGAGPADGPWRVVETEAERDQRSLTIVDQSGDTYRLFFDPVGHRELATGSAMIASRLYHALGYNVPETYLVRFEPERLKPDLSQEVDRSDVRAVLNLAPPYADGTYRAVALHIPGAVKDVGGFSFHGTRRDDGNDVFPHEARRELRGLRVLAAWMNHTALRASRTKDVVVQEDGRHYVRHYLYNLTEALGSGTLGPKPVWAGHEHLFEFGPVVTRMGTLGFSGADWQEATFPSNPAIGNVEAEYFDPLAWSAEHPNPAFERSDGNDAFWAARQVMHFTDADLRAIVETAEYSDPEAAAYLTETLVKRRGKIGEAYLNWGGGLDRFDVHDDSLRFTDLLAEHGVRPPDVQRTIQWHGFDNATGEATAPIKTQTTADEVIAIPSSPARFLLATITTPKTGQTHVYLRRRARAVSEAAGVARSSLSRAARPYEVVGLRREPLPNTK